MKSTNLAKKNVASIKDRYEKELGQLPDIEPRPTRPADVPQLIEPIRRLQRTVGRLTTALIFLSGLFVMLAIADHWTAIQAALADIDRLRQQWWH